MFVFVAIVLACLVKCPLAPFHSWLMPAYYEAPPVASALMSGAMSKLGAFGLLKLALPLAPDAAAQLAPYLVALAVVNIVYGAMLALRERSYKKLVAYASLSHMGYIVLGIFSFEYASIQGSMLQMLSHAHGDGGTVPHSRHAGTTARPGLRVHDCTRKLGSASRRTAHGVRADIGRRAVDQRLCG